MTAQPELADPEKQLAWERRHRPRAAIAALISAVALLVYNVAQQILQSDVPKTSGLETLLRAVEPGNVNTLPSLQTPFFEFLDSKGGLIMLVAISGLIGWVALAWAVGFLAVATRERWPMFRRWLVYVPIVGGVLLGVGVLLRQVGTIQIVSDFLDSKRTVADARDGSSGLATFGALLLNLGSLGAAIGILLTSLNAMRAGLLTRMLGYIGVAAGAMLVLVPLPIVQIFWLASLAFILLGRWPGGELPAWRTGEAVPWPTPERPPPRQRRTAAPAPAEGPTPTQARRKRKKRH